MRSRWTALLLVLVFAGLTPRSSQAQAPPQTPKRQTGPVAVLKQNYPNPFNPETKIPFTLVCNSDDPSHQYLVSLTIYNALAQPYAVPLLQSSANVAGGQPLSKLRLSCGDKIAYWNGKILGSQQEAASGNYRAILEVDGHRFIIGMFIAK